MAAPSFINAQTGATDTTGVWSYTCQASSAAGNLFVIHILSDGTTNAGNIVSSGTNIESLAGTDNTWTEIIGPNSPVGLRQVGDPLAANQYVYMGRALSTSAPTVSGTGSGDDVYVRSYQLTDVSTGTTIPTVIENIGGTSDLYANTVGTSNTASDTAVTTSGPDRLALNFVAVNDDNAISAFTGETGGDWALATAPYADSGGTDGAIGLQIATISSAATIDGGTGSIVDSDAWGVVGFALIGTTVAGPTYQPRDAETFHDFR